MKKSIIGVMVLSALILPSLVSAAYNDVSLTTDTVITAGGINLSVAGSADVVSSIEVASDGNSFTVVLEKNSIVKVTSSDRRVLTTDAPAKYKITDTCTSSLSTLELASYAALVTIKVTPSADTCTLTTTPSTSGTRSSGGGGRTAAVTSTAKTVVATAPVATAVNTANQTAVASITRSLERRMTGDDVRALQTLLSTDISVYPEMSVTGYFGPATERAVKAFQAKYKLPTVGVVGPMTRAMLMEIFGAVQSIAPATPAAPATPGVAPATPAVPASASAMSLSRSLKPGTTGNDVKTLQQFLNANGFTVASEGPGSSGNETNLMGTLTVEAVKKFQEKYGIVSSGTPETTGYGMVGPKTRAKINELSGQ